MRVAPTRFTTGWSITNKRMESGREVIIDDISARNDHASPHKPRPRMRRIRVSRSVASAQLLRIGGLAGLPLLLPDLFRQASNRSSVKGTFGRAKSVIMLYLHGGHAQQETFDPKPDGPSPEKGEFGAIATSVPGPRVGELLPRFAGSCIGWLSSAR